MFKVVIADDEKRICRLVQALADWAALGMEVAGTAENGLEALERIKELAPDILITDIRMPGCDGLELIQRARELCPELEIIIISGYAHFEYAQSAIQYGVSNYLLKPINKEELTESLQGIRERLEKKRAEEIGSIRKEQESRREKQQLQSSLIRDIIAGNLPELTKEQLRESYRMETEGGLFQAFLIRTDGAPQRGPGADAVLYEKIREACGNALDGVCLEKILFFQNGTVYGILNYQEEYQAEVRKRIRDCLNYLDAKKGLYGGVEFSAAVGSAVREAGQITASMAEARTAVMERLLEGGGRLFEPVHVSMGQKKQELLSQYSKAAGEAIDAMDRQAAADACSRMEKRIMECPEVTGKDLAELVIFAGRFFISRTAVQDMEESQRKFEELCAGCSRAAALFDTLAKEQERLLSQMEEQQKSETGRPVRLAKQYVMQHYKEPITLEEICELIGFSSSYFSVLFKKETGEGFARFLTRVRMEEAKTLLRETGLSVAEICEEVGYSDRKHFTQTFHKMTGLNPAEYRKLYG